MYGSYEVNCVILEKFQNDTYKIRYYDIVLEDEVVGVVSEDRLIFPKHSQLIL
jgi:hypothetical protein